MRIPRGSIIKNFQIKLSNDKLNEKCYWKILKCFLNCKKIPCITPLPHEDKFLTDFLAKNQILNSEIAKRSSLLNNESRIPH